LCKLNLYYNEQALNVVSEQVDFIGLDVKSRYFEWCVEARSGEEVDCAIISNDVIECE
jgi:hypothetical protein